MDIQDFNMDYFSLKGKNAIVTGGNTGLGQAFALALAKAGANLLVPSIMPDSTATRNLIEAQGVNYEYMQIDITAQGAPRDIVEVCMQKFGSLDILVNNAGICINTEVEQFGREP
jgi:NAD(P)-dependent dehydrogenase (short-subunit alcohol dehydrogenase family)